jgi:hypothetical protein
MILAVILFGRHGRLFQWGSGKPLWGNGEGLWGDGKPLSRYPILVHNAKKSFQKLLRTGTG